MIRFSSLSISLLLLVLVLGSFGVGTAGAQVDRSLYAPVYQSSQSIPDFLSRVARMDHLEAGDSVMLNALKVMGKVPEHLITEGAASIKCGTGLLSHAHRIAQFTLGQGSPKDLWRPIAQAIPGSDTSIQSPSGQFTIFYYVDGDSATTHSFAQSVALYADEALRLEVEELGYVKPPYTGPDSTYHIYILNLGRRSNVPYGYTEKTPNGQLGPTPSGLPRSRTFLVLDNDFTEDAYSTKGLDGARITIFHEFHHMIQFGSYGELFSHSYFQEMTATWVEMYSTPDVEDYIQYIPGFVNKLTDRFDKSQGGGYGQSIWLEYLAFRHEPSVVRNIWEYYRSIYPDPVTAFDQVLRDNGSSFACTYAEFGEELFFTGNRTRLGSPFGDASMFPAQEIEVQMLEPGKPKGTLAIPLSLTLFSAGFEKDTVVLSIARDTARLVNANIVTAKINSLNSYETVLSDTSLFCESFGGSQALIADVFPQPFILSGGVQGVHILVSDSRIPVTSRVAIHTTSMSEITTIENNVETIGGAHYVNWNGRDAIGRIIPSGIYLYSVDADGQTRTGKIVVIRK